MKPCAAVDLIRVGEDAGTFAARQAVDGQLSLGEGVSKKGGGLGLAGAGSAFFGVAGMDTTTFKESAVGEAQELARRKLIKELVAKKDGLSK